MTAGVTGGPIEVGAERTHSKTSRDVSHSQLSTALRNALRSLGAETEGPFLLAIDELDKLPNREALLKTVNAFKDLLHLRNVHVAMTLSDEALGAFELRQTTERDAFDSTFDTIIDMERLDQAAAIDVVDSRVPGFPRSLTLLCFVWAGGLPRDLLRHARTCMDYVRDLDPQPTWQDVSFSVARSEAARKMGAAVRAGSPAIGNLTIRTLTETWSSRPPTAQDLEPIEGLDESSARLCAYAALCFATIWVVLRAEGASPETARVLTLLRDGVVATALVGSLETAGKLLTMLNEGGHFAGPEPQTDADYGTEDAQVRRGPLDSSIWWS